MPRRDQNDLLLGWHQPAAEARPYREKLLPRARQAAVDAGIVDHDSSCADTPLDAEANRNRVAQLAARRERQNSQRKRRSSI